VYCLTLNFGVRAHFTTIDFFATIVPYQLS